MTALRVLVTGASLAAAARKILEGIGAAVVLMPSGTSRMPFFAPWQRRRRTPS